MNLRIFTPDLIVLTSKVRQRARQIVERKIGRERYKIRIHFRKDKILRILVKLKPDDQCQSK